MSYKVDNAIIMAAGASSRFVPLSYEMPKALIPVRGEVLIEREIRQLKEAGVPEIILVVGYRKEQFAYLADKFGVKIIENPDYNIRNNNSTIHAVREYLGNTYICSSDNYFTQNPFEAEVSEPYYAAVYADGKTPEWCMQEDAEGYVSEVTIGGSNAWYMLGHVFWDKTFSEKFLQILDREYDLPETADLLWEAIYRKHLDELKLKIRRYPSDVIFEFDSLDELREFDPSYWENTHSAIIRRLAAELGGKESELTGFTAVKDANGIEAIGCSFEYRGKKYEYSYENESRRML